MLKIFELISIDLVILICKIYFFFIYCLNVCFIIVFSMFIVSQETGNHAIPKVEYKRLLKSNFEQSFVVKKICSDVFVIKKFNEDDPEGWVNTIIKFSFLLSNLFFTV